MTAITGGAVRRLDPTALVALVFAAPLAPVDDAVAVSRAARVARRGCDAVRVNTLFTEVVGAAPVLGSAVAARAARVLNESLDTAVANDQLNRAPLLVFEITILNNEVVAYFAVIHMLGEILARPSQFVVVSMVWVATSRTVAPRVFILIQSLRRQTVFGQLGSNPRHKAAALATHLAIAAGLAATTEPVDVV